MNVGFAYNEFGYSHGIERISAELARSLVHMGHEVSFYCSRVEPGSNTDGVTIQRVPTIAWPHSGELLMFASKARKKLESGGHDVTHSYGSVVGCDVVTAQSCHIAGLHEAKHFMSQSARRGINLGAADRIRLMIERQNFQLRKYRRVIAASTIVQRELIQWYGVPPEDITVIANGVSLAEFSPTDRQKWRTNIRTAFNIADSEFMLLFVGNEFARKGLDTILRSLPLLNDKSVHVVVCGGDDDRGYRSMSAALGIGARVHFAGHQKDVAKYYSAADAFVLPTFHEAFGLVIIEAMASGLPVIVSRVSGAGADAVSDGQDGLLLSDPGSEEELASKINQIMTNMQFQKELGLKARKKAGTFGWDTCARKVHDVYLEISDLPRKRIERPL